MGPLGIVVEPPSLDDPTGVIEIEEPVLVEALVAKAAVEGLNEGVLARLAGLDEGQLDAVAMAERLSETDLLAYDHVLRANAAFLRYDRAGYRCPFFHQFRPLYLRELT